MLDKTPTFSTDQVADILLEHFRLDGVLEHLPGERDQNFRVDASGHAYVLKIANGYEDPAFIEAQHGALRHVAATSPIVPTLIPTAVGRPSVQVDGVEGPHIAYLVTWLDGTALIDTPRRSDGLYHHLGETLGTLDAAFAGFDHPAVRRDFHWDIAHGRREIESALADGIVDGEMAGWVARILDMYAARAEVHLPGLPTSVIHSDANPANLICGGGNDDPFRKQQRIVGIIDFGDMVHTYTVAEIAIALAYALLLDDDPLRVASAIVGGYHETHPLSAMEADVVWPMALLRLATSAAMAARQASVRPDDPYLTATQAPLRAALPRLLDIPVGYATAVIRHACDLPPVAGAAEVIRFIEGSADRFHPVMGTRLTGQNTVAVDWSVGSHLLDGDVAENSESRLTARTAAVLATHGAAFGLGAHGECRLVYTGDMFAVGPPPLGERRTLHLACDLFAPAGAPVHAPLDGTVHSTHVNTDPEDYGHVIMLTHSTDDGTPFHSLFGHLSASSHAMVGVGDRVRAGDRIGTVGEPEDNGGWTPHVHVQLITDMLDHESDFPGVGAMSHAAVWQALSPDPTAFCSVDPAVAAGAPTDADTFGRRQARVGPGLSVAYRNPLEAERGWMQYLWDAAGQRHLDAYNNVPHVGHAHPAVIEAGVRQMRVLNTNTRYLNDLLGTYAERLAGTMPDPLEVCYFVNSASEANELALRLMRAATGRRDLIVLEDAYHGHTTGLIDISPYKHDGPGGRGAPSWVHTVPLPDTFRGRWRAPDPDAAVNYAAEVGRTIDNLGPGRLGGFLAETCPSVGGQIILPPGYLADVYARVRAAGGIVVADEVQTGFGRLGSHFYGFQQAGVVPDVVVLGKPIGNGHPIGAVVTTRSIADAFDNGMEFFSTFGGNTVSCAVGLAVLDVLEGEQLQDHAHRVGTHLVDGLHALGDRHQIVGDVRGSGFFLGVDLIRDPVSLEPAGPEADFVCNMLRDRHILIGTDGAHHNVLKIRPPMPFSMDDADLLLEELDVVLGWV